MKKSAIIVALGILISIFGTPVSADIVLISDNFDDNTGTFSSWVSVGAVTTNILYDADSLFDGGLTGGDMLDDDGGLRLDTVNSTPNDEAIGLTIGGTMDDGEIITFNFGVYNDNASFSRGNAQLFNLTDGIVLATSGEFVIDGTGSQSSPENIDDVLSYTAMSSDVGDVLQIRFLSGNASNARDVYVDNFSISSTTAVPEPSSLLLFACSGLLLVARRRKLGNSTSGSGANARALAA